MIDHANPSPQRLPDLYSLLSLPALESDLAVIEAAISRLASQATSDQLAGQPAQQVARKLKLHELSQYHLLSADRKRRYDQKWRQVYGKRLLPTAVDVRPIAPQLAQRLPTGDPCEAFRLSEYLQSTVPDRSTAIEAEYEKLRGLLLPPQVATAALPVRHPPLQASAQTISASPSQRTLERHPLPRQRRRQREQWWLWSFIGGLACVGCILGGYFWYQTSAADSNALTVAKSNQAADYPTRADRSSTGNSGERRSGLPNVSGLSPEQNLTEGIEALIPVPPSETAPDPASDTAEMPELPAMANMPAMPEMPAPADVAVNLSPADLTDEERTAWGTLLQEAKQQLGRQEYALASEALATGETLAKTSVQRAQLDRLKSIGRLAEELQQAMQQALDKLGAGEVITIGTSTPVSFVDWEGGELTVRIRGQNRKFRLTDVPIGLAFALSDLSLDATAPATQARKAAFTLLHPGAAGNDLATQRAREMMLAAVAAGVVNQGLEQVFDDDYDLNVPPE
jgi:hypothetical protein